MNSFKKFLNEKKRQPLNPDWKDDFNVYVNPTSAELNAIYKKVKHNREMAVRGYIDTNNDLVVQDTWSTLHYELAKADNAPIYQGYVDNPFAIAVILDVKNSTVFLGDASGGMIRHDDEPKSYEAADRWEECKKKNKRLRFVFDTSPDGGGNYKVESTELYKIYCDLDGVVCNFLKGFKDMTGMTIQEYEKKVSRNASFAALRKGGAGFWANLEWLSDGKQLWNYIKKYSPQVLTRGIKDTGESREGKEQWCKRELQLPVSRVTVEHDKEKYSSENRILIDDDIDNIKKWKAAGGIGILHTSTADTLKQLKELGL